MVLSDRRGNGLLLALATLGGGLAATLLWGAQDAHPQAPNPAASQPEPAATAFTVQLTQRLEVKDHRGRLAPYGKTLFVERWDSTGQLKALDARTGKGIHAFDKRERAFDLSPDGKRLSALLTEFRSPHRPPTGQKKFKGEARYYDEMKVWDVTDPRAPRQLLLIPDASRPVFAPDGKSLIVFTQANDKARHWELWSLAKGKRLAAFPVKQDGEYWPAFSPGGDLLALPAPDGVRLHAAASGAEVRVLAHRSGRPPYEQNCVLFARSNASTRTAFSPDGKTLATGGDDGKVKVWDVKTGRLTATLTGHSRPHTFLRYSPDGRRLLTGSVGVTEVVRVAPGLPGKGPPVTARAKVIDRGAGEVILWDARTLVKERTLPIRCPVSLSWSPDGALLAAGDQSGAAAGRPTSLQLWDAARGQLLGTWAGFDEGLFSTDGRTLIASAVGRVVLWDVQRIPRK
jgi:WD40 repeat protein